MSRQPATRVVLTAPAWAKWFVLLLLSPFIAILVLGLIG